MLPSKVVSQFGDETHKVRNRVMLKSLRERRLGGWTRTWILATLLWAVLLTVWQYPHWQKYLTLDSVQSRHVESLFNDLALAIDRAEGGRLRAEEVDKAADTVLGSAGKTITAFEALAKDPPVIVQRMKRVGYAAPENDMEVRYYVFPVETTDREVAAALSTESSRQRVTEWGRTEPPRLDVVIRDAASAPSGPGITRLETNKLLADYYQAVERLPRERLEFVFTVLAAFWLAPALVLYAMGSSVGWAARGFRETRAIHYFGSILFATAVLLVAVMTLSQVETRFQCSGEMSSGTSPHPIKIFLRLTEYRWWVGLWNDSDGFLRVEIPNKAFDSFEIAETGDFLRISETRDSKSQFKGTFSTLSSTLTLETSAGLFDGTCTKIN